MRANKRLQLASLTRNNIGTVRKIHSVLLPVNYSDAFYQDILSPELEHYSKLVYFNDVPCGVITAKFEDPSASSTRLYIATIGVLPVYRHQGAASLLIDNLIKEAQQSQTGILPEELPYVRSRMNTNKTKDPSPRLPKKITAAYLHVHTANEDARKFWESKGWTVESTVDNYYSKLEPRSAWLMSRAI